MKRRVISAQAITAAENDSAFDDIIGNIKADFEYIIDGLETLNRRGADSVKQAMSIATSISADLEQHIAAVADSITN